MRSVVYVAPDEIELRDTPCPAPGPGQVLVRTSHVGICGSDMLIWGGGLPRVVGPVVLGHEFAGVVEEAPNGSHLHRGDQVAVEPLLNCGRCAACRAGCYNRCEQLRILGIDAAGGAAEFVVVPEQRCHVLPESVSLRAAVLAEPLAVAVHMVRRAGVGLGHDVAVLGGGTIGCLVAAVCRQAGAASVTIVELDERRRKLASDALALDVVEPSRMHSAGQHDIVFEATGAADALAAATGLARPGGTVLLGGLASGPRPVDVPAAVLKELHLLGSRVYVAEDFTEAIRLIAGGAVPTDALITDEIPLERAIDDAYGAMRAGRSLIKTCIRVGG